MKSEIKVGQEVYVKMTVKLVEETSCKLEDCAGEACWFEKEDIYEIPPKEEPGEKTPVADKMQAFYESCTCPDKEENGCRTNLFEHHYSCVLAPKKPEEKRDRWEMQVTTDIYVAKKAADNGYEPYAVIQQSSALVHYLKRKITN